MITRCTSMLAQRPRHGSSVPRSLRHLAAAAAAARFASTGGDRLASIETRLEALEQGSSPPPTAAAPALKQAARPSVGRAKFVNAGAASTVSTADPWRAWRDQAGSPATAAELVGIKELEKKIIWLSTFIIHHANTLRPSRDGLKVGGHQASSTSLATVMAALYYKAMDNHDRVAVKPHASPIFHSIQYLLGNQELEQLQNFRALGGVQSYPSVTKDSESAQVDFSTGSVGLGAAVTTFSSLVQDFLVSKDLMPRLEGGAAGRMIARSGRAE
eukprot:SAG22_NODE_1035_length_5909_cov_4.914802_7_plen_272_part_00